MLRTIDRVRVLRANAVRSHTNITEHHQFVSKRRRPETARCCCTIEIVIGNKSCCCSRRISRDACRTIYDRVVSQPEIISRTGEYDSGGCGVSKKPIINDIKAPSHSVDMNQRMRSRPRNRSAAASSMRVVELISLNKRTCRPSKLDAFVIGEDFHLADTEFGPGSIAIYTNITGINAAADNVYLVRGASDVKPVLARNITCSTT